MSKTMSVTPRIFRLANEDSRVVFTISKRATVAPHLTLTVTVARQKTKRCDLGHEHVVAKEEKEFVDLAIRKEDVPRLTAWLLNEEFIPGEKKREEKLLSDVRDYLIQLKELLPAFSATFNTMIKRIDTQANK